MKHVDTYDVEKQEQETDTEDIYNDEQREEMLDEDEITASENAFMQGREQTLFVKFSASFNQEISYHLMISSCKLQTILGSSC